MLYEDHDEDCILNCEVEPGDKCRVLHGCDKCHNEDETL